MHLRTAAIWLYTSIHTDIISMAHSVVTYSNSKRSKPSPDQGRWGLPDRPPGRKIPWEATAPSPETRHVQRLPPSESLGRNPKELVWCHRTWLENPLSMKFWIGKSPINGPFSSNWARLFGSETSQNIWQLTQRWISSVGKYSTHGAYGIECNIERHFEAMDFLVVTLFVFQHGVILVMGLHVSARSRSNLLWVITHDHCTCKRGTLQ